MKIILLFWILQLSRIKSNQADQTELIPLENPLKYQTKCSCVLENQMLRCQNGNMKSFPEDIISSCWSLINGYQSILVLDLSGQSIESIGKDISKFFPSLRKLYLNRNKLQRIPNHAFEGLHKLETLDLEGNNIDLISPGGLDHLSTIKTINLLGNPLKQYVEMA